ALATEKMKERLTESLKEAFHKGALSVLSPDWAKSAGAITIEMPVNLLSGGNFADFIRQCGYSIEELIRRVKEVEDQHPHPTRIDPVAQAPNSPADRAIHLALARKDTPGAWQ